MTCRYETECQRKDCMRPVPQLCNDYHEIQKRRIALTVKESYEKGYDVSDVYYLAELYEVPVARLRSALEQALGE